MPLQDKHEKKLARTARHRRRSSRMELLSKQQNVSVASSAGASSLSDNISDAGSRSAQVEKMEHKFDISNGDLTNRSPLPNIATIHEEQTPSVRENGSDSVDESAHPISPNMLGNTTGPSIDTSDNTFHMDTKRLIHSKTNGSLTLETLSSDLDFSVDEKKQKSPSKRRRVSLSDTVEIYDDVKKENGEVFALTGVDMGSRIESDTEPELQVVMERNEEEEKSNPTTFHDLSISPVPTPVVFRPETRDQSRMTITDKVTKILNGQVHVRCPPEPKIIRIFINYAFTGQYFVCDILVD